MSLEDAFTQRMMQRFKVSDASADDSSDDSNNDSGDQGGDPIVDALTNLIPDTEGERMQPYGEDDTSEVLDDGEVVGDGESGEALPDSPTQVSPQAKADGKTPAKAFRHFLSDKGYEVPEEQDEESLADAVVQQIQKSQRLEAEVRQRDEALARQQQEISRLMALANGGAAAPAQQPAAQPAAQSAAVVKPNEINAKTRDALIAWANIEMPPAYQAMCTLDEATGRYKPVPEYGEDGVKAARMANEYATERQRRGKLVVNNFAGALEESGAFKVVESIVDEKLNAFKQQTEAERQQVIEQVRREQEMARIRAEHESFYKQHQAEMMAVNADGSVKRSLDGSPVLLPFGKKVQDLAYKIFERAKNNGVQADWSTSVMTAYYAVKDAESLAPPPAKPNEVKKEKQEKFLDKAKSGTQATVTRPASTARGLAQSRGRGSFSDMFFSDPDNAEILGASYRGER